MTEQEKRDDLVLEIAQQLCENAGYCQDCPKSHSPEEFGECELHEICNILADYILRKEKEVQKKTKNILDRLEKYIIAAINDDLLESYIRGLFVLERKHFGIEVEE